MVLVGFGLPPVLQNQLLKQIKGLSEALLRTQRNTQIFKDQKRSTHLLTSSSSNRMNFHYRTKLVLSIRNAQIFFFLNQLVGLLYKNEENSHDFIFVSIIFIFISLVI